MTDLSIIILNYNTSQHLGDLLDSILKADLSGIKYEVLVVDNGSTDSSLLLLKKQYRWVRLVANEQNFGFSKANNIGSRMAKGVYLLFLNSDTLVEKDSIKQLFQFLRSSPVYVGGTGYLALANGQLDPAAHRGFPTPWNAFCYFSGLEKLLGRNKLFGGYHQGWLDLATRHPIDCISGACFMIRTELFRKLGGWDESYFMYGEDIDFCYQLKHQKYQLVFLPSAKFTHFKRKSGREKLSSNKSDQTHKPLRKKTKEHFFYTMKMFYDKNYKDKYPKLVYRLVLLGIKIISKFRQ
jgi:hypothetical protein